MKIAVTYDNGNVFQHFGKTREFKVYAIEDGKVCCSEVIGSDGAGHGALAAVLAGNDIDVLICGGLGAGAQNALASAGIEVCSGAQGDADAAVQAYLNGELQSAGATCDHHGEDHVCGNEGCGHDDHSCGECGNSSCGTPQLTMEGKNAGKTCRVHYRGTLNDGTQFDSSYAREEPLEFVCATGMMIPGFDAAVVNMNPGERVNVHLMPEEAYGMPNPDYILTAPIKDLPGAEDLRVGMQVMMQNPMGQAFPVKVTAMTEETITLDANHDLAGQELNFEIELIDVK